MLDGLYQMIDGVPYAHPVTVLLALLAGAQIPNIVRFVSTLSRFFRYR